MNKTYDPKSFEKRIYSKWLEKKYFSARPDPDKKPFTIVMPPPNITGQLHMGHALDGTVQDILTRYKRMKGFEALWLPGTDHASIATEVKIVEKMRKEGLTKEMIGRDRLYEARVRVEGSVRRQNSRTASRNGLFLRLGQTCFHHGRALLQSGKGSFRPHVRRRTDLSR